MNKQKRSRYGLWMRTPKMKVLMLISTHEGMESQINKDECTDPNIKQNEGPEPKINTNEGPDHKHKKRRSGT